jgi:DNA-binding response OmpR family regulator
VLRRLAEAERPFLTPVLILTGRDTEWTVPSDLEPLTTDQVAGPFSVALLMLHVRQLLQGGCSDR